MRLLALPPSLLPLLLAAATPLLSLPIDPPPTPTPPPPSPPSIAHLTGLTSLRTSYSKTSPRHPDKYFHESLFHHHYDGRFASAPLPQADRLLHMRLLLRAYSVAMRRIGVETWMVHGSLLAWWWGAGVFPWDSDLDFCVGEGRGGIGELGAWWNMTVHGFAGRELGVWGDGDDDGENENEEGAGIGGRGHFDAGRRKGGAEDKITRPEGLQEGTWDRVRRHGKKYLLEVNPHFTDASTRDKYNVIDARFIDTATGLFIDITTVHPVPRSAATVDIDEETHHFRLDATAADERAAAPDAPPEEMYTKDTHLYTTASLFPLRETVFEGSRVLVPYAYEQLLQEEYGSRALVETWFDGWQFERGRREWVVAEDMPAEMRAAKSAEGGRGRGRGRGRKPKWRPVSDEERSKADNQGGTLYVPQPGRVGDVHVVPGSR